jgi:hypothetical protein
MSDGWITLSRIEILVQAWHQMLGCALFKSVPAEIGTMERVDDEEAPTWSNG